MRFVFLVLPDCSMAECRVLFLEICINTLLTDLILTVYVFFFFVLHVKISLFQKMALVVFKYL